VDHRRPPRNRDARFQGAGHRQRSVRSAPGPMETEREKVFRGTTLSGWIPRACMNRFVSAPGAPWALGAPRVATLGDLRCRKRHTQPLDPLCTF
jgi:hypothetical protein